ncbi:MAG: hypothetical protein A2010_13400 [Nitrospirae bacterium GWD2_57_9]|nr:MAG: hypothetical protein A2010_13400 [Nitrospirae bacterium GWD2_57_9]OGW49135.1 MAG: hypothetical protein A2078_09910 [Nitrospirae bacterium GWC2_57_9]
MIRKTSAIVMLLALTVTIGGCGGGGGSADPGASPTTGFTNPGDTPSGPLDGGSGQPTGGTGSATFAWDAPTTNEDGTALADLAGFKLYVGTAPGRYTSSVTVGNATSYKVTDLPAGTYYAVVTAYNRGGAESIYSNEVVKPVF